ncbi:hypothetical protein NOVOSPHI9U_440004 [Novosphingobium sp. 9U]|nr:hypothetical protein NOVOSPHI9U_440004 [Novosphingobium sp. 9U]
MFVKTMFEPFSRPLTDPESKMGRSEDPEITRCEKHPQSGCQADDCATFRDNQLNSHAASGTLRDWLSQIS